MVDTPKPAEFEPDWMPQASAHDLPEGLHRFSSVGQLWKVVAMSGNKVWERVRNPTPEQCALADNLAPPSTDDLDDLLERLELATVASCNCVRKSSELSAHEPQCHYRLFRESADALRHHKAERRVIEAANFLREYFMLLRLTPKEAKS